MAKTRRRRRLKSVDIDEVSFVDKPANLTPFLFIKNDEGIEKAFKSLNLKFSTKGSPDDTVFEINGRTIQNLQGASFWYTPIGDDTISLMVEYTVRSRGEDRDGFRSMRTHRLIKNDDGTFEEVEEIENEEADQEDIDVIKSFLKVDEINELHGKIAKQLAGHIKTIKLYEDILPPDMAEAIQNVTKLATEMEVLASTSETEMEKSEDNKGTQTETPIPETEEVSNKDVLEAITGLVTRVEGIETKLAENKVEQAPEKETVVPPAAEDIEEEISAEQLGTALGEALVENLTEE